MDIQRGCDTAKKPTEFDDPRRFLLFKRYFQYTRYKYNQWDNLISSLFVENSVAMM